MLGICLFFLLQWSNSDVAGTYKAGADITVIVHPPYKGRMITEWYYGRTWEPHGMRGLVYSGVMQRYGLSFVEHTYPTKLVRDSGRGPNEIAPRPERIVKPTAKLNSGIHRGSEIRWYRHQDANNNVFLIRWDQPTPPLNRLWTEFVPPEYVHDRCFSVASGRLTYCPLQRVKK